MNKEEVKFDHFKDIEELIKHLEMWYAEDDYFAYERYFHLRDARIMGMFIYELQQENQELKDRIDKAVEYIEKDTRWFDSEYASIYGALCTCAGAKDNRLEVMVNPSNLLEILKGDNNE